jgi:hypothetical protein
MPPQQPYGLLHLIDEIDDFGAHDVCWNSGKLTNQAGSIKAAGAGRQPTFDHRIAFRRLRLTLPLTLALADLRRRT